MSKPPLAHNFRRLARMEIPGGGQVAVQNGHAFIGHMKPPYGTSIIDVADPTEPRLVTTISHPDERSHSHKVRVVGDIMIVNMEQNDRHALRRGLKLEAAGADLRRELGREPNDEELGVRLNVPVNLFPRLREYMQHGYTEGGFKIYDVSSPSRPRELAYVRTHGVGVHRFDMDERYAYISTEMKGFHGNILVVYDIADPSRPEEISRWWMPGQNTGAGEIPSWTGLRNRLHHALRVGDELWASAWYAGVRVIDATDIRNLRTVGAFNYHPPFPEPTHTVVPVPVRWNGRRVAAAVDEEHEHTKGQLHAGLWFLDVENLSDIRPIGMFHLSELDSPFSGTGARFGAHQFHERVHDNRLYCAWFAGGLRMIDISDPTAPDEIGWFLPEPSAGQESPQSNDVFVDQRGLVYLIDRDVGFDILEPQV